MQKEVKPYLIDLKAIGSADLGYLTVAENGKNLPFNIKRVFWSYDTPELFIRGYHAHYKLEQILVAMSGKLVVTNEDINGQTTEHTLESPDVGLYIPPMYWHLMQFSNNAVMMSLASMGYDESDYIREYEVFQSFRAQKK
jgi:dTDP-4-dehydrorhamnose 3,5-epimerase-like enzyme